MRNKSWRLLLTSFLKFCVQYESNLARLARLEYSCNKSKNTRVLLLYRISVDPFCPVQLTSYSVYFFSSLPINILAEWCFTLNVLSFIWHIYAWRQTVYGTFATLCLLHWAFSEFLGHLLWVREQCKSIWKRWTMHTLFSVVVRLKHSVLATGWNEEHCVWGMMTTQTDMILVLWCLPSSWRPGLTTKVVARTVKSGNT